MGSANNGGGNGSGMSLAPSSVSGVIAGQ